MPVIINYRESIVMLHQLQLGSQRVERSVVYILDDEQCISRSELNKLEAKGYVPFPSYCWNSVTCE